MDTRILVVNGVHIEASTHPFPLPQKRLRSEPVQPQASKRLKTLEIAGTSSSEAIWRRMMNRFEVPEVSASRLEVQETVPDEEGKANLLTSASPAQVSIPAQFLQLLDCLNNLQSFNSAQAQLLSQHGIPKYVLDQSRLTVWDKGYRPPPRRDAKECKERSSPIARRPKVGNRGRMEGILAALGIPRPLLYTGSYVLPRQRRSLSLRDSSLQDYRCDPDSLFNNCL